MVYNFLSNAESEGKGALYGFLIDILTYYNTWNTDTFGFNL